MLDDDPVLEYRDLGVAGADVRRLGADLVTDDHQPVHRFAAGQELGLGKDRRPAAAGVAAVPPALPLGLQSGGAADALNLVVAVGLLSRRAFVHDGVGRVVGGGVLAVLARTALPPPAPPAPAGRAVTGRLLVVVVIFVVVVGVVVGPLLAGARLLVAVGSALLTPAPAAATAAAAAPAPGGTFVVVLPVVGPLVGPVGGIGEVVVGVAFGAAAGRGRLRRDEQRHVGRRRLRPRTRGWGRRGGFGRQRLADLDRIGLVDAGLRAAGAAVEAGEDLDHPFAGGAQKPRQGVHPQAFGQLLGGGQ